MQQKSTTRIDSPIPNMRTWSFPDISMLIFINKNPDRINILLIRIIITRTLSISFSFNWFLYLIITPQISVHWNNLPIINVKILVIWPVSTNAEIGWCTTSDNSGKTIQLEKIYNAIRPMLHIHCITHVFFKQNLL